MGKSKKSLKRLLSSPSGLQKIAEAMLAPLKRDLVYDGRIKQLFATLTQPCAKCTVIRNKHKGKHHPWFENNLVYLEWEAAKHV